MFIASITKSTCRKTYPRATKGRKFSSGFSPRPARLRPKIPTRATAGRAATATRPAAAARSPWGRTARESDPLSDCKGRFSPRNKGFFQEVLPGCCFSGAKRQKARPRNPQSSAAERGFLKVDSTRTEAQSLSADVAPTPTLDAPVPARAAPAPSQEASPPGILPHHLADLRRSGLSDATIKASRVFSEVSLPKVKALLETKSFPSRCLPALVFPFTDAEGRNGYCRLRVDHPRTSGGKAVRYESPRGQANQIYLPPGVADVLATDHELLMTEGEKKALAATQAGFPCIGLVGVFGWKQGRKETLLPALERIAWKGRAAYIVYRLGHCDKAGGSRRRKPVGGAPGGPWGGSQGRAVAARSARRRWQAGQGRA